MAEHLARYRLANAKAIAGTGTGTSDLIDLRATERIEGIQIRATSAFGTPDIRLQMAISPDGTALGGYDDNPDVLSSTAIDFTSNNEGWHSIPVPPVTSRWVKFQFSGNATNPGDSIVDAYLLVREKI